MLNVMPGLLASLIALTFVSIGAFYIISPLKMIGSFGLKSPALDSATLAWLRLKGIRDVASGIVIAALLLTSLPRTVGIVLIALAVVPLGDMANVVLSGGRKATAFAVHGLTCLLVLATGIWSILAH